MEEKFKLKPMKLTKLFSVGHRGMDAQHQRLFDMINALIELQDANTAIQRKAIIDAVPALVAYTLKHFASEEGMMRKAKTADYEEHIAKHKELVGQVSGLMKKIEAGDVPPLEDLLLFLKHWLMNHILVTDKRYAEPVAKMLIDQELGANEFSK